jgi:hypothetical protein
MYGGHVDQAPRFIRHGFWTLGWTEHQTEQEAPDQVQRRDQIQIGDRIAIKRMMGKGSSEIRITALGIVTDVDPQDKRVYVCWAATDLNRVVDSRGCFKSIHGPFTEEDPWVKEVFRL